MLAIILSFCAGAAVSFVWFRLKQPRRSAWGSGLPDATVREREIALHALLVEHKMREMLGKPHPPTYTADVVAEARRALQPLVVIKVKP